MKEVRNDLFGHVLGHIILGLFGGCSEMRGTDEIRQFHEAGFSGRLGHEYVKGRSP